MKPISEVKNGILTQSTQEMLQAIGYELKEEQLPKVAQSAYYTIILD